MNQEVTSFMKSSRFVPLSALLLLLAPAVFAADFGIRAGTYADTSEQFLGAELLFDLGSLNINPNVEYSLEDDVTEGTVSIDLTYDVTSFDDFTPFVGAGLGLLYTDDELGNDDTNAVGNLIGGVSFRLGRVTPYVQLKYFRLLDDDVSETVDDMAFTLGLRF
jgi:opacity protein-like surface antigen